jgi:hypothetical protein
MERDRYRHLLNVLKAEKGLAGRELDEYILPPMPKPE